MLFLDKHQIIFETKSKFNFSKFILAENILVKEMNWVYKIVQGCKGVFVSSYKETLRNMNNAWS